MSHFLITGAAGFIGSHASKALIKQGHQVTGIDDLSGGKIENIEALTSEANFTFIEQNILKMHTLDASIKPDFILHYAAKISVPESFIIAQEYDETNVSGTVAVLEFARDRGVKRVIFSSSTAVYGDTESVAIKETQTLAPMSPYAIQKKIGEDYMRFYAEHMNVDTVILRYFNVYGVGQDPNGGYAAVIPKFIDALKKGNTLKIFGDGTQTRDFVSVKTVVQANINACLELAEGNGEVFNVGSSKSISLLDLCDIMYQLFPHLERSVEHLPERAGDIKHSVSNTQKLNTHLKVLPTASLKENLNEMVESPVT